MDVLETHGFQRIVTMSHILCECLWGDTDKGVCFFFNFCVCPKPLSFSVIQPKLQDIEIRHLLVVLWNKMCLYCYQLTIEMIPIMRQYYCLTVTHGSSGKVLRSQWLVIDQSDLLCDTAKLTSSSVRLRELIVMCLWLACYLLMNQGDKSGQTSLAYCTLVLETFASSLYLVFAVFVCVVAHIDFK